MNLKEKKNIIYNEKENIYDWPQSKRKDTMYLSTIKLSDIGANAYKKRERNANLKTDDINNKKKPKKTRINSCLTTENINNKKKIFYRKVNYGYNKLSNKDIKGSKTDSIKFKTKREPSNPLNPIYKLQKIEKMEPFIPKFIRDSFRVDDIEGTKSKWKIENKKTPRKVNYINDIPLSRPKKEYKRKVIYDSLKTSDINKSEKFISNRCINPLDPVYKINKNLSIGRINKNFSKVLHRSLKKTDLNLKTKDIDGARYSQYGNKFLIEKVN